MEAIQDLDRILNEADQERLAGVFAPYLKGRSGQYVYRVKGMKAYQEHLQAVGQTMNTLIQELRAEYAQEAVWQMFERFFSDNYHLKNEAVQPKGNDEIGSGCLQSPDDLEATYRQKNGQGYKGYVANLTETCDPKNDLQLITRSSLHPTTRMMPTCWSKLYPIWLRELTYLTSTAMVVLAVQRQMLFSRKNRLHWCKADCGGSSLTLNGST